MPNMFVSQEIRNICYKQKDTVDAKGNKRTIVHHIDFNHDNNDPENLIFVSKDEHRVIHEVGFKKGHEPWNKGKTGVQTAWNKGATLSDDYKAKISDGTKKAMQREDVLEKVHKASFKKGHSPWNKGKKNVQVAWNKGKHYHLENGKHVYD